MNEDRKYEIVGKVEIGTDEYRDLITQCAAAQREYEKERDRRWEVERERDSLRKKVEALEPYNKYVVESCHDSYKLWLLEKQTPEEDDF